MMQIERFNNSELLSYFEIDNTKEFDIRTKQQNGTSYIFIYYNLTIVGNVENKLLFEKIEKYLGEIETSKNKVEFILYFSKMVNYFSLTLIHTLFYYLNDNKYKNKTILRFIGNNNKSSMIISQMLFTQYLTNNFIENIFIYSVNDTGALVKWNKSPKDQNDIPSITKFVISDEFSPVVTINENHFDYFFNKNKTLNLLNSKINNKTDVLEKKFLKNFGNKKVTGKIEENRIFNMFYNDFLEKYDFTNKKQGFKDWYFSFYYFDIWKKLRLFTDYLNSFKYIEISYVKGRLYLLKAELEKLPVFKILILHIILTKSSLFKNFKKNDLLKYTKNEKREKDYRSEERRVGKECRSRWSPYH